MAIAKQTQAPVINEDPKLVSDVYDTITENPIDTAVKCVAKDLEGTPMETTYYAQRLGRDDSFKFQDQNLSPSYQSYVKITGLMLNVIETPEFTIDSDSGIATGNGVAIVSQYMKFNPGDTFYANAINNERTLFRVETAELTSVHRGAPYRLTYSLVGPVTDASVEIIDLENKVYKEYFYDEDYVSTCSGPLLTEEEKTSLEEVKAAYVGLTKEYLRLFSNRDTDAILYEVGGVKLFDPYLHEYLVKTIPPEYYDRRSIRGFSTNDFDLYTIFTYLLEPGLMDYTEATKTFPAHSKSAFQGKRSSMYLHFTTVDYFVDSEGSSSVLELFTLSYFNETVDVDGVQVPLLPDTSTGAYVVSDDFYDGTTDSILEVELAKLIAREDLDIDNLILLARSFKRWSLYEKFYIGAVLLTLLKIGSTLTC